MKRLALVVALLPVLAAGGEFVTNPATTLPGPKIDGKPVPAGADTAKLLRATDFNALRDAALDLRDYVRAPNAAQVTATGTGTTKPLAEWMRDGAVNGGLVTATGSTTPRSQSDRAADVVNVRDFGAVGDGVTDDTAAIQAALDSGAGTVDFGDGRNTYRVTARITLPTRVVRLAGRGATIHSTHGTEVFYRGVLADSTGRGLLVEIDGLTFTGNATAFRYSAADTLPSQGQLFEYHVRNCRFLQTGAVYALHFHGAREGRITDSYFEGNQGIYADYTINMEVARCDFKNTTYGVRYFTGAEGLKFIGGTMLGVGTGIWFGSNTTGLQIIGAMIDYCDVPVLIDSATAVMITGSYISSRTAQAAIYVTKSTATVPAHIRIANNVLRQNSLNVADRVVRIENADDVIFTGNSVENYRNNGLEYDATQYLTISHNTFRSNAGYAGQFSITAGTDSATVKIWNNYLDEAVSAALAVDRVGNTGPGGAGADKLVKGLQVSGGAFYPPTPTGAAQNNAIYQGAGAPNDANGGNGDVYFRTDTPGVANQRVYVKSAGAWVGIL